MSCRISRRGISRTADLVWGDSSRIHSVRTDREFRSLPRVPAADPARRFRTNPFADFGAQIRIIARDRILAWAVAGNTYLWFLAALLQFVIVIYGHDVLHVDETPQISYLQAAVGIGIGVGSLTAGYLSFGEIEYGLVPLGSLGMTVFGFFGVTPRIRPVAGAIGSGIIGFFRRVLRGSAQCTYPTPSRARTQGRNHCSVKLTLIHRNLSRRRSVFRAVIPLCASAPPRFFWLAPR